MVIEKFKDHEFGILLYSNIEKESKAIVDLKRVKKKLEEIKILPSNLNKAIRIEKIDDSKNTSSELEFNDFILREIINLNASVAIVIHRFISDSIYSEININEKLIKTGIQRVAFKIISSPFRLADVLKDNVESLLKLTMIDSIEVEIVEPKTNIERAITSNRHYEKSTIILERIFEVPNGSPERKKRIEQAESELKKSIQLDSLNDKSLAMLAYIQNTEMGNHDNAAIYYERAKKVQPHNFSYTWNLAQTYYLTGETEKAILTLEEYLMQYGKGIKDASQKMEMEKLLRSFQEFK